MEILQEFVTRSVLCWLATVDATGAPNVSPKEVFDVVGDQLVIANIASPRSSANIRVNPLVCVSLLDVFEQEGLRISGRASVQSSNAFEAKEMRTRLETRTEGLYPFSEMFVVDVHDVKPFKSPSWHLFPDINPAERRAAALRTYGVQDLQS
jgi:predicted pyridoxine 5'-phosphate oxidase superfamily flavin-nucleotide-binding protein